MPPTADIARCYGRTVTQIVDMGGHQVEQTYAHEQCARCRRREPVPDGAYRSVHIAPPEFDGGKCPSRIDS